MKAAKAAVSRMLDLLPPVDWTGDPRAWTAKAVELFSRYPAEVMTRASHAVPERSSRPTISLIKTVLEELYAPILREEERQRAEHEARLCLPAPRQKRTAEEQARADEIVARTRAQLGIPERGLGPKGVQSPPLPGDGRHGERIAGDLARRQAMKGSAQ